MVIPILIPEYMGRFSTLSMSGYTAGGGLGGSHHSSYHHHHAHPHPHPHPHLLVHSNLIPIPTHNQDNDLSDSHATSSSHSHSQYVIDKSDAGSGGLTATPPRRSRGWPPGSKYKPKPPNMVTHDTPNSLHSHLLEVSSGADLLESLSAYACQRGRGVSVLSANSTVFEITIRQPMPTAGGGVMTLQGHFEILSMGTVLPPPAPPGAGGLSIMVSAGQGQVIGGNVVGPLLASGPILIITASFSNIVYERLPLPSHHSHDVDAADEGTSAGVGHPFFDEGDHHNVGCWPKLSTINET